MIEFIGLRYNFGRLGRVKLINLRSVLMSDARAAQ